MDERKVSAVNMFDNAETSVLILLNYKLPVSTRNLWNQTQLHICADGGSNRLYHEIGQSFVPDHIVGDLDSVEPSVKEFYQSKGTVIHDKSDDQETTDLHKCVAFVDENYHGDDVQILVLGGLGGRFDHEMGNINVLHHFSSMKIALLSDENIIFLLPAGFRHELKVRRDAHCGLIPFTGPSLKNATTGLRWNLSNTRMRFGDLISTSNITDDETVTVVSDVDLLWTMEKPIQAEDFAKA